MNEYFKARKRYRRNIIIGIAVCLYLYLNPQKLAYQIFWSDWGAVNVYWPWIILILYFIYAKIRKGNGKEAAYTGRLRIIPKLFVIFMMLSSLISGISI